MSELPPRSPADVLDAPQDRDVANGNFPDYFTGSDTDLDVDAQAGVQEDRENHTLIGNIEEDDSKVDSEIERPDDTQTPTDSDDEPPHDEPEPDQDTKSESDVETDADEVEVESPKEEPEPEQTPGVNEVEPEEDDTGAKILEGPWKDDSKPKYESWMFETPIKGIDPDDRHPDPNREHNVTKGPWPDLDTFDGLGEANTWSIDDAFDKEVSHDTPASPADLIDETNWMSDQAADLSGPDGADDVARTLVVDAVDSQGGESDQDATMDSSDDSQNPTGDGGDEPNSGGEGGDGGDEPPSNGDSGMEDPEGDDNNEGDDDGEDGEDGAEDAPATPMTHADVVKALSGILTERDPERAGELSQRFWEEFDERGLTTVDGDEIIRPISENVDTTAEFEFDDGDEESEELGELDGTDEEIAEVVEEEPELTPAQAEMARIWSELEYSGPLDEHKLNEYPTDSIAARKLKLDAAIFEKQQLELDSRMFPERRSANEARLDELNDQLAQFGAMRRAKNIFTARFADETYVQFTPEQLDHLREIAVGQMLELDPRRSGSAERWDVLQQHIDSIDRTRQIWQEVVTSKQPLQRALQLGRKAIESAMARGDDGRMRRAEGLLSETEAILRNMHEGPMPYMPQPGHVGRRVAGSLRGKRSRADADGSAFVKVTTVEYTESPKERSLRKRAHNDKLEQDLQKIERARRQQVAGRRKAVKEAMDQGDKALGEGIIGPIRGKGNAPKGYAKNVREFGSNRPARPRLGSSEWREARREHATAVRNLHDAQREVRKARASLNKHEAGNRALGLVPWLGAVLVPDTVLAQARLEDAIAARDNAARNPLLRLPPKIGRYIG